MGYNRSFSRDKYEGHTNKEIKDLNKQLIEHRIQAEKISTKIREIEDDCDHIYLLASTGAYDDCYCCSKCGHEYWK